MAIGKEALNFLFAGTNLGAAEVRSVPQAGLAAKSFKLVGRFELNLPT
jgi:hypothetical protein